MGSDRYDFLTELETDDFVQITFSTDDDYYRVENVEFPNPWKTDIAFIREETKDPREGDDVRHIEFHRTVELSNPNDAESHDKIHLTTKTTMEDGSSTGCVYKKYNQSEDGDFYTLHPFDYESIELIEEDDS